MLRENRKRARTEDKDCQRFWSTAVWHRLLKMLVLIARTDDEDCQRFWSTAVWHRLLKMLVLIARTDDKDC